MSGIHLVWNPVDEQLESLRVLLEELRREVSELRTENAELRQQVSSVKCDVGYWNSRHADAVERNANSSGRWLSAIAAFHKFPNRHRYCRVAPCFAPKFTLRCFAHTFGECLRFPSTNFLVNTPLRLHSRECSAPAAPNRILFGNDGTNKNPVWC